MSLIPLLAVVGQTDVGQQRNHARAGNGPQIIFDVVVGDLPSQID